MDNMMKDLLEKQLRSVNKDGSILLHDDAHLDTANHTQSKILELDFRTIDQPPRSPDFLQTDYPSFRNLDELL